MKTLTDSLSKLTAIGADDSIIVALDISGSTSPAQRDQYQSIVQVIANALNPASVTVIQFDHRVYPMGDFLRGDEIVLNVARDGGGSSIIDVYDFACGRGDAKLVVIITDGWAAIPDKEPMPTLWLITSDHEIMPWGTMIRLEGAAS